MKKKWEEPIILAQKFVPNEYVAACGDSGKVYKFKCDAGGGKTGLVYLEKNGQDGLQLFGDQLLSSYHACGETHEADSDDAFLQGYYVTENGVTPVIVWRGPDNNNTHCTENLDISSWETAKS